MNYSTPPSTSVQAQHQAGINVPPEPNPTIGGELDVNEKRLAQLHNALNDLESRLSPVLRNAKGTGAQDSSPTPPMPWSAVVCALRNAGYQTEAATARIQDLLSRLEV